MKIKMHILAIAIVLAIIVFGFSTYLQKQMIHYEATISCLVLARDVNENEKIQESDFKKVEMPISIVATQKIVTNFEEIKDLYAKDNMKACQIAVKSQFDTKENLSIYEAETGKEKISIKIKNAENGMSFQIKPGSSINVYATLRNEYAEGFLEEKERAQIGNEIEGYTIIKVLENINVLGTFSVEGIEIEKNNQETIDSVLIAVTPEEAKQINLIRDIATFNVTGVNYIMHEEEQKNQLLSGDEG